MAMISMIGLPNDLYNDNTKVGRLTSWLSDGTGGAGVTSMYSRGECAVG